MSGNKVRSLGLCHVLCLKLGDLSFFFFFFERWDLSFHSTTLRVTKLWWWIYHVEVKFLCHGDGLVSRSSSPCTEVHIKPWTWCCQFTRSRTLARSKLALILAHFLIPHLLYCFYLIIYFCFVICNVIWKLVNHVYFLY